jgi:hypothetical protein
MPQKEKYIRKDKKNIRKQLRDLCAMPSCHRADIQIYHRAICHLLSLTKSVYITKHGMVQRIQNNHFYPGGIYHE